MVGGPFNAPATEIALVLYRMSYSSIIRESEDLGCGIFDVDGNELCESESTPMHIGSLPWYIRGFKRRLEGKINEGDVIIHNHPYFGASHTPDMAVIVPIFHQGRLLGFGACPAPLLAMGRVSQHDEPLRLAIQVERLNEGLGRELSQAEEVRIVLRNLLATGPVSPEQWQHEVGELDSLLTRLTRLPPP